jgi:hypothetical protein
MTLRADVFLPVFALTRIGLVLPGTEDAPEVLFLASSQQLSRLGLRDSEYGGQILRPDLVPVNQVKDLLRIRRGVGHHLLASEGKQPGSQPVRIRQQGP